ncbi:MAG: winged helix-turn-helix transcriptional regulator [Candidatus Jordarchaeum sp.]|uniref:winged helix-turn-helix transcriptional regulator n=1 Tax=Candidatus Jordarchaeum sp. TaxID=2823881 RepID=UPI00404ACB21
MVVNGTEELFDKFDKLLRLRDTANRVLVYILTSPRPVTPKELIDNLGLTENSVWKTVRRLESDGFIRSVERGEYEPNFGFITALLLFKVQELIKALEK